MTMFDDRWRHPYYQKRKARIIKTCLQFDENIPVEYTYLKIFPSFYYNQEIGKTLKSFKKIFAKKVDVSLDYYYLRNIISSITGGKEIEIEKVKRLLEEESNDPKIYCLKGYLHLVKNENIEALDYFNKALDINSGCKEAYLALGIYHYRTDKKNVAIDYINKCLELNEYYFEAYTYLANYLYDLNLKNEAIDVLNDAIDINPNNDEFYTMRGFIYMSMGLHNSAIEDFNRAIEIKQDFFLPYFYRGISKQNLKLYYAAIDDFTKAIKLNFYFAPAHAERAHVNIKRASKLEYNRTQKQLLKKLSNVIYEDIQIANKIDNNLLEIYLYDLKYSTFILKSSLYVNLRIKYALEAYPNYIMFYWYQAVSYATTPDLILGLDICNKVLKSYPDNPYFLMLRGYLHSENLNYYAAIEDYIKALEKMSDNLFLLEMLIEALEETFEYEALELILKNYLSLKPEYYPYFQRLAEIYNELKKYNEAIEIIDALIDLDYNVNEMYKIRAKSYLELKKFDEAIEDITKLINLEPTKVENYIERAKIFYKNLKKYDDALNDIQKAIELEPNNMELYLERGVFYFYIKNYKHALKDFKKATTLNDQDKWAVKSFAYLAFYHAHCKEYKKARHFLKEFDMITFLLDSEDKKEEFNLAFQLLFGYYIPNKELERKRRYLDKNKKKIYSQLKKLQYWLYYNKYDEIIRNADIFFELYRENNLIDVFVGVFNTKLGCYKDAYENFEESINYNYPHYYAFWRGYLYKTFGKLHRARKFFETVIEHDNNHKLAKMLLKEVKEKIQQEKEMYKEDKSEKN